MMKRPPSSGDPGPDEEAPEFPHINMRRWPFDVVPSTDGVEHWIGRREVGIRLRRVGEGAVRVPASRIILVWATFGSGKTHALRHVEYLARKAGSPVAGYVVVPRGIKSFLDIFKVIVDALMEKDVLSEVGQRLLGVQ